MRRRIALSTRLDAAFPYFLRPEDFLAAIASFLLTVCRGSLLDRLAHDVPVEPVMSSRTGLEAEAISRLTDGLQPAAMRAILVQCLAGELAPSTAISRMLAAGGAAAVRVAIDNVTHRAATVSRASDRLVRDRVDELTQVFVEEVAELADVSEVAKSRPGSNQARASRASEFSDRDERQISE